MFESLNNVSYQFQALLDELDTIWPSNMDDTLQ